MSIVTLHSGPAGIIKTPADIAAYIVRHSLKNPGFTSSFIEDQLISFRKIESEFTDRDEMLQIYEDRLTEVINRNIPDNPVTVEVKMQEVDGFNYELSINVMDSNGVPLLVMGKISITKDTIKINFDTTY